MGEKRYEPVSCDYHDQLEAASMHQLEVELDIDGDSGRTTARGKIQDVFTADGAEYVNFVSAEGSKKIRLDKIAGFRDVAGS